MVAPAAPQGPALPTVPSCDFPRVVWNGGNILSCVRDPGPVCTCVRTEASRRSLPVSDGTAAGGLGAGGPAQVLATLALKSETLNPKPRSARSATGAGAGVVRVRGARRVLGVRGGGGRGLGLERGQHLRASPHQGHPQGPAGSGRAGHRAVLPHARGRLLRC